MPRLQVFLGQSEDNEDSEGDELRENLTKTNNEMSEADREQSEEAADSEQGEELVSGLPEDYDEGDTRETPAEDLDKTDDDGEEADFADY